MASCVYFRDDAQYASLTETAFTSLRSFSYVSYCASSGSGNKLPNFDVVLLSLGQIGITARAKRTAHITGLPKLCTLTKAEISQKLLKCCAFYVSSISTSAIPDPVISKQK
jgi:hypothetical protein